jgi:SAM-dependent methyltransferase
MQNRLRQRRNLAECRSENWRPPLFTPLTTRRQRLIAALRLFFDLQTTSSRNHLVPELEAVRGRLLDVGCGAQPFRTLLGPDVAYTGIDTVNAKAHFGYEMPDTLYFSGETWPVPDAAFDVILCTETLEHVLDPRTVLAEAHRCLRPGGHLLMTVPFAARWHFIPHDYWRYTPSSLKHLLQETGFGSIGVYARGNALTVACYKAMGLLFPFVMPQTDNRAAAWAKRLVVGLPSMPLLMLLAVVGRLSLRSEGGDDCLGYTVVAERPADDAAAGSATGTMRRGAASVPTA